MPVRLFIAEKPSLAKAVMAVFDGAPQRNGPAYKIGDDYFVPLQGHILEQAMPDAYLPDDVPTSKTGKKVWRASDLPILPRDWQLVPSESTAHILEAIRMLMQDADEIVHLGDPDAEGQLLVDEVLDFLACTLPVKRLLVNDANPGEVRKALQTMRDNRDPQFRAWHLWALARSRYDWEYGLNATRAATCRAQDLGFDVLLSVGSVQTPTLQLVATRDAVIDHFTPVAYFLVDVVLQHAQGEFSARWRARDDQAGLDESGRLVDAAIAQDLVDRLEHASATVSLYERKPASERPPLPLSLNELTVMACRQYGCTAAEVMEAAQALYDRYKLTTYPRTENRYLSEAQQADAAEVLAAVAANRPDLAELIGAADTTLKSAAFDDKRMAGTPHHGIVPTVARVDAAKLGPLEQQIYDLIVRHYLVQFYAPATFMKTTIEIACVGERLTAGGRTPVSAGWHQVLKPEADEVPDAGDTDEGGSSGGQLLPELAVDDPLLVTATDLQSKQTKPPGRFDESTLIAAMVDLHKYTDDPAAKARLKAGKGIGTSATRAGIIADLRKRGFLEPHKTSKTKFQSSATGRALLAALPAPVKDPAVAGMFKIALDAVADGEMSFDAFMARCEQLVTRIVAAIGAAPMTLPGRHACPVCKTGNLRRISGKDGFFWGCSNFRADPPCKASYPDADGKPDVNAKPKGQKGQKGSKGGSSFSMGAWK
ncbi:DNA topoisomerase [Burkholderia alba]|uniref:DNA topoisomerase n=1 Tax=Burkholderia alba TaxID=2683677 RepID=UPI002B057270|nr:DNA topoisomerase [Burkholderia alba]